MLKNLKDTIVISSLKGIWTSALIEKHLTQEGLESKTLKLNELSAQKEANGEKIYRTGFGQSPFPVPKTVVEELRKYATDNNYLPVQGLPQLRKNISEFMEEKYGYKFKPDNIFVGPGSKIMLYCTMSVLNGPIILPTPCWVSYFPQTVMLKKKHYKIPTTIENSFKPTAKQIEGVLKQNQKEKKILLLNYPSNPSGVSLTWDECKDIAKVVEKYDALVMSDEIYGELYIKEHTSVAKYIPHRTICYNGMSKTVGAGGWRFGCLMLPESLEWMKKPLGIVASNTYSCCASPIQYAAIKAFDKNNEEMKKYLKDSRRICNTLRTVCYEKLQDAGINCAKPTASYYMYILFDKYAEKLKKRGIKNSVEMCVDILEKSGVAILQGTDFQRPEKEYGARLCIVNFDGEKALDNVPEGDDDVSVEWLNQYCKPTLDAMDELKKYVDEL